MWDVWLAVGIAAVDAYALGLLYTRHGFPDMFATPFGMLAAGLFAASVAYVVASILYVPEPMPDYGEEEEEAEVERVWQVVQPRPHQTQPSFTTPETTPKTGETYNGQGGVSILEQALAQAILKTPLRADIGLHVDIPEHQISLGGSKATVKGSMVLQADGKASAKPEPVEEAPVVKVVSERPPAPDIRSFLRQRIEELKGRGE
jgi:hypothetical protein